MNILLEDGLPFEYEGIPLSANFRNMIQVDLVLHEQEWSETERTFAALNQLYEQIPEDINQAIRGLAWFFSRGQTSEEDGENAARHRSGKGFDYNQDANFIYAAFYATYHISLTTIKFLHWWEFLALFEALPETTLIKQIMYWRVADTSKMSKTEREHVLKMRKLFPLKNREKEQLSVDELNAQTKERVARRLAEAKRIASTKKQKQEGEIQ